MIDRMVRFVLHFHFELRAAICIFFFCSRAACQAQLSPGTSSDDRNLVEQCNLLCGSRPFHCRRSGLTRDSAFHCFPEVSSRVT